MPPPLKPSEIVARLSEHVIGQEAAKKTLAVAVYAHFRRQAAMTTADGVELSKSNILLIGPTGTGKTLLCETLARILELPFVTADATSLAQTQFVGEEIEAILHRLLDRVGGDLDKARHGIVFIDEIDKLKTGSGARATSGESVQHALLKIMEGAPVRLRDGRHLDTTHILFICGGAFVGLDQILDRTHGFGFISAGDGSDDLQILERLNARIKPTDLLEFGLIPEFAGRLPIVTRLHDLTQEMLMRILTEPKNAIARQFAAMLRADGVELRIAAEVYRQIADLAIEYKAGARSLRGIFEEMMCDVLYTLPDNPAIRRVTIRSLFEPAELESATSPS